TDSAGMIKSNGDTLEWYSVKNIMRIKGGADYHDDVVFIKTDSPYKLFSNGKEILQVEILEDLKRVFCFNFLRRLTVNGILKVSSPTISVRYIDFGQPNDGNCDNEAILYYGTQSKLIYIYH